jgi:hypothetical protein
LAGCFNRRWRNAVDRVTHGIVRGRTIELAEDLGLPDGDQVEIVVRTAPGSETWGDGIRRSAGGWINHPEVDAALEQIHQQRRNDR